MASLLTWLNKNIHLNVSPSAVWDGGWQEKEDRKICRRHWGIYDNYSFATESLNARSDHPCDVLTFNLSAGTQRWNSPPGEKSERHSGGTDPVSTDSSTHSGRTGEWVSKALHSTISRVHLVFHPVFLWFLQNGGEIWTRHRGPTFSGKGNTRLQIYIYQENPSLLRLFVSNGHLKS